MNHKTNMNMTTQKCLMQIFVINTLNKSLSLNLLMGFPANSLRVSSFNNKMGESQQKIAKIKVHINISRALLLPQRAMESAQSPGKKHFL